MTGTNLLFGDFLSYLRRQGFIIGVDHHLRLRELLNKLGPDCKPLQLKYVLCPIFATSEKQQKQFYRAFDSYFQVLDIASVKKTAKEPDLSMDEAGLPEEPPAPRKWQYILLGILLVIFAVLLIYRLGDGTTRETKPLKESTAEIDKESKPGEKETGTGGAQLQMPESEFPKWKYEPTFFEKYRYIFHRVGMLLPIIILLLMEGYRYSRRRLILVKQRGKKPPFVWPVKVEMPEPVLVKNERFYRAARLLRKRLKSDIYQIDIHRTVSGTVERGGFPELRYKYLTRPPEYLILIDLPSYRDHYAHLCDTVVKALEKEGLFVNRYFYENDPRVCFKEPGGQRVYLSDLKARYSGHRLIIFGEGDELLDPISGELDQWTALFQSWRERAVLTPGQPKEWGMREIALAKEFIVLPASLEGLNALKDHFETATEWDLNTWRRADAQAHTILPEAEEDVDKLREYLGEEAFQWLCACAVYPELHWDLTLYLGSLPCMPENLINEENVLRLIRLPWFRSGAMPDELRWALIGELDTEKSRGIRKAIVELLEKSPAPGESYAYDTYRLHLVVQRWMLSRKDRKQRKEALKSLKAASERQKLQDYTLMRFLESATKSPLHFILPRRLRKIFYRNGVPFFGFRTGIRVALAAVIMVVLFLILKPAEMPLEVKFVQSKGIAVYKNAKGCWEADYGDGIIMVYIPAGKFTMGQTDDEMKWLKDQMSEKDYDLYYKNERPPHDVYLDGYWMGKYEITFDQYDRYCEETKKKKPDDEGWGRGKRPVINVSWDDAVAYCKWLSNKKGFNFKLPTEAQWENAARGNDGRKYPWGNSEPSGKNANFADKQFWLKRKLGGEYEEIDDGYAYTAPVGSYREGASPYGLLDMAGNVWEWCSDWYRSGYYENSPEENPTGPSSGSSRVFRGGGWSSGARALRCSVRFYDMPSLRDDILGFRLSQDN